MGQFPTEVTSHTAHADNTDAHLFHRLPSILNVAKESSPDRTRIAHRLPTSSSLVLLSFRPLDGILPWPLVPPIRNLSSHDDTPSPLDSSTLLPSPAPWLPTPNHQ